MDISLFIYAFSMYLFELFTEFGSPFCRMCMCLVVALCIWLVQLSFVRVLMLLLCIKLIV